MIETIIEYLIGTLFPLVWELLSRPWLHIDTLWMILPLILILVLIHLYFGRYRKEELGWNSAFGNSVSLLWICVILGRDIVQRHGFETLYSEFLTNHFVMSDVILVSILTVWVIVLLFMNYFHVLPKKIAFIVSSSDSVYILAYVIISLVVGNFIVDKHVILAAVVVFVLLTAVLELIKIITPMSRGSLTSVKKKKKKDKKKH
ncbi:hypothetical protein KY336_03860 [Candidatus Woesearchaeota archaeon]|nr:hypothetical protein [Candidatus Woesearchaeota archaeon]